MDAAIEQLGGHSANLAGYAGDLADEAVCADLVERGWGRVVFVSSESAVNIPTDTIHYGPCRYLEVPLRPSDGRITRRPG